MATAGNTGWEALGGRHTCGVWLEESMKPASSLAEREESSVLSAASVGASRSAAGHEGLCTRGPAAAEDRIASLHEGLGNAAVGDALRGDGSGFGGFVRGGVGLACGGLEDATPTALSAMRDALRSFDLERPAVPGGAGAALPRAVRRRMEAAFGHDFAHVRVHDHARAARFAQDLNAHAAALGADLYFNTGSFAPGTPDGDRLLAHELTHVVQHDQGRLPRDGGVSHPTDPAEVEAYANESRIVDRLPAVDAVLASPGAASMRASALNRAVEALGGGVFEGGSEGVLRSEAVPSTAGTSPESAPEPSAADDPEHPLMEVLRASQGDALEEELGELAQEIAPTRAAEIVLHRDGAAAQATEELDLLAFSVGVHVFVGEDDGSDPSSRARAIAAEFLHIEHESDSSEAETALAATWTSNTPKQEGAAGDPPSAQDWASPEREPTRDAVEAEGPQAPVIEEASEPVLPGVTGEDHLPLLETFELDLSLEGELTSSTDEEGRQIHEEEEEAVEEEVESEAAPGEEGAVRGGPSGSGPERHGDVPSFAELAEDQLAPYVEEKAVHESRVGGPLSAGPAAPAGVDPVDVGASTDPRGSQLQVQTEATDTVREGALAATEQTPSAARQLTEDAEAADGPTAWWGDPDSDARSDASASAESRYAEGGEAPSAAGGVTAQKSDFDEGMDVTMNFLTAAAAASGAATMVMPGLMAMIALANATSRLLASFDPELDFMNNLLTEIEGGAPAAEQGAAASDPQVQSDRSTVGLDSRSAQTESYAASQAEASWPEGSSALEQAEGMRARVESGAGVDRPGDPGVASDAASESEGETEAELEGAAELETDAEAELGGEAELADNSAREDLTTTEVPSPETVVVASADAPTAAVAEAPTVDGELAPLADAAVADAPGPATSVDEALQAAAPSSEGVSGPPEAVGGARPGSTDLPPPPVEAEQTLDIAAAEIHAANREQTQLDLQRRGLDEVQARIDVEEQALGTQEELVDGDEEALAAQGEEIAERRENQDQLDEDLAAQEQAGAETADTGRSASGDLMMMVRGAMDLITFFAAGPFGIVIASVQAARSAQDANDQSTEAGETAEAEAQAAQGENAEMRSQAERAEEERTAAGEAVSERGGLVEEDRAANAQAQQTRDQTEAVASERQTEAEAEKLDARGRYDAALQTLLDWVVAHQEARADKGTEAGAGAGTGTETQDPAPTSTQPSSEAGPVPSGPAGGEVDGEPVEAGQGEGTSMEGGGAFDSSAGSSAIAPGTQPGVEPAAIDPLQSLAELVDGALAPYATERAFHTALASEQGGPSEGPEIDADTGALLASAFVGGFAEGLGDGITQSLVSVALGQVGLGVGPRGRVKGGLGGDKGLKGGNFAGGFLAMANIAMVGPETWWDGQLDATVGTGKAGVDKLFAEEGDFITRLQGVLDILDAVNNAIFLLHTILSIAASICFALWALFTALSAMPWCSWMSAIAQVFLTAANAIIEVAGILGDVNTVFGLVILGLRYVLVAGRAVQLAADDADPAVQAERAQALEDAISGAVGETTQRGIHGATADASQGRMNKEVPGGSKPQGSWTKGKKPTGSRPGGPTLGAHRAKPESPYARAAKLGTASSLSGTVMERAADPAGPWWERGSEAPGESTPIEDLPGIPLEEEHRLEALRAAIWAMETEQRELDGLSDGLDDASTRILWEREVLAAHRALAAQNAQALEANELELEDKEAARGEAAVAVEETRAEGAQAQAQTQDLGGALGTFLMGFLGLVGLVPGEASVSGDTSALEQGAGASSAVARETDGATADGGAAVDRIGDEIAAARAADQRAAMQNVEVDHRIEADEAESQAQEGATEDARGRVADRVSRLGADRVAAEALYAETVEGLLRWAAEHADARGADV